MKEHGRFPVYINNQLYLLQLEDTRESKQFKDELRKLYGKRVAQRYYSKNDGWDIKQIVCQKIAKEYKEKEQEFAYEPYYWRRNNPFLKLAHDTVHIHSIIPLEIEGDYRVEFTVDPYIVYNIDQNIMSDYVNLTKFDSGRFFSLFQTEDLQLSKSERFKLLDAYFSLLEVKDISPYFAPRIQCSFDIEESRQKDVLSELLGKEQYNINYETIYKMDILTPSIQQQLLSYFLQENPGFGRLTDQGIELLHITDKELMYAEDNKKILYQFPKFMEKLSQEFGEKEKEKNYIKK